jgi:hypothetical protein
VKPDTGPFDVGELNVQLTLNTSSPPSNVPLAFESWNRLIVADVNAMSVIVSVHRGLGQSGAPGIGVTGGSVVIVIVTFPFLMFGRLRSRVQIPPSRRKVKSQCTASSGVRQPPECML